MGGCSALARDTQTRDAYDANDADHVTGSEASMVDGDEQGTDLAQAIEAPTLRHVRRAPTARPRARGRHTYLVHPGAAEGLAALVEQRWVSRPELLELAVTELLSWLDDPSADVAYRDGLLATLDTAEPGGRGQVVAVDTYADTRERLADAAQELRVSMNRLVNLAVVALVAAAAPPPRGRPVQLGKPSSRIEPELEERLRAAMRRLLGARRPAEILAERLPTSPTASGPR
jgi:hypothetical protein